MSIAMSSHSRRHATSCSVRSASKPRATISASSCRQVSSTSDRTASRAAVIAADADATKRVTVLVSSTSVTRCSAALAMAPRGTRDRDHLGWARVLTDRLPRGSPRGMQRPPRRGHCCRAVDADHVHPGPHDRCELDRARRSGLADVAARQDATMQVELRIGAEILTLVQRERSPPRAREQRRIAVAVVDPGRDGAGTSGIDVARDQPPRAEPPIAQRGEALHRSAVRSRHVEVERPVRSPGGRATLSGPIHLSIVRVSVDGAQGPTSHPGPGRCGPWPLHNSHESSKMDGGQLGSSPGELS